MAKLTDRSFGQYLRAMRSRIVSQAVALFARRGIDGVSIAEVAVASGVSKANVMHHFGTKDGLYAACLDVIDAHLHTVVDDATSAGGTVSDLRGALEIWAEVHPEDPRLMAYGLLRLPERDGRWALSDPVLRMIDLVSPEVGDVESAAAVVVDLLGNVTYREMARPIVEAHRGQIEQRTGTADR